ncbi:S41 family peptidase [Kitasatospora sp. NPDC097691]|uniref:S41 family peptidase n=1 Tax=Kitasatospora sp. NPDC097691 TaxID=3157231 RepID=UPI00332C0F9D
MTHRPETTLGRIGRATAAAVALATAVGPAAPGTAVAQGRPGNALEGVWQTDGYGLGVAITGGRLTTYDVTAHSCVPAWITATQAGPPGPDGTTRYTMGTNALTLTPKGRNRAVDREEGGVGTTTLNRLDALPPLCARPAPNDPLAVFDRFWETFEENYPFFAAKGIDWHAVRGEQRRRITPTTTTAQLQDVLVDMLRPLGDAHTGLARVVDGQPRPVFGGRRPGTTEYTPELHARALQASTAQLTGPEQPFAGGRIGVGRLPDGIGYLRVSSFEDYTDGDYRSQADELDRALDALLAAPDGRTGPDGLAGPDGRTSPDGLAGLVVDVRLNRGGSDALGLHIAARLTDRPYLAYRKVARNDPADPTGFTRPEPIPVQPSAGGHFTGPVAVLTSSISASAAETFTQAMTGRSPHVVRIGENTQGVFSDVLIKTLSPELMVVLPNEEYLTRNGSTFDGPGIPPDVRTPVFTPDELAALRDSALSTARRVLAEDARGNQSHQDDHGEQGHHDTQGDHDTQDARNARNARNAREQR